MAGAAKEPVGGVVATELAGAAKETAKAAAGKMDGARVAVAAAAARATGGAGRLARPKVRRRPRAPAPAGS